MRSRVDVGIAPYIETIRAFHSTYRSVSEGGGRHGSRPTGVQHIYSLIKCF